MARCPTCNVILDDDWLKRAAAALMGKRRYDRAEPQPEPPAICSRCRGVLSDEWLKHVGATLMGKSSDGDAKARTSEQARAAAHARWDKVRAKKKQADAAAVQAARARLEKARRKK